MLFFEYDMIRLRFAYDFPFVFPSVPMVFLWSSFGLPMVLIWFCSVFRWNSFDMLPWFSCGFLGVPNVFLWFAKDPEATVTDGSLAETDGKTQGVTVTDGD